MLDHKEFLKDTRVVYIDDQSVRNGFYSIMYSNRIIENDLANPDCKIDAMGLKFSQTYGGIVWAEPETDIIYTSGLIPPDVAHLLCNGGPMPGLAKAIRERVAELMDGE